MRRRPFQRQKNAPIRILFFAVLFVAIWPAPNGQAQLVDLGDRPPELKSTEWLTGQGVRLSDLRGRSLCVVDFFRSWYPPCRFQLLEEFKVQKELGKETVVFIGLTDEPAWQVRALAGELPREFLWHVGLDRNDSTLKLLLGPAAATPAMPNPLPRTAILDRAGRVVYFGPPPDDLKKLVGEAVSGTWDVGRGRKRRDDERLFDELAEELKSVPAGQCGRIVSLVDRLVGLDISDSKANMRADALHTAADKLLDDGSCSGTYDRQALRYARLGAEGHAWYAVYETLAKALFRTEQTRDAVLAMKKAVDIVGDRGIKARLQSRLAEYAAFHAKKTGETLDLGRPPEAGALKPAAPEKNTPPAELTSAQAVADLESLHAILLKGYAGYDDFDWKLRLSGSSWRGRLKDFQNKASGRATWPIEDFFRLAAEFLGPIVDEHFYLELPKADGEGPGKRERFTVRYSAFLADLRVADDRGRMVVRSAADAALRHLIGLELRHIPISEPETAALDVPYLFPAVPESPGVREYLLGVFLSAEPREPRMFTFYSAGGGTTEARLSLHRCRVKMPKPGQGDAWSFQPSTGSSLPVLAVRTADKDKLTKDFLKTAETLRAEPAAILDLRANGGGSDSAVMDWCGLLCPRDYQLGSGNAIVAGGSGSAAKRWNPLSLGIPSRLEGPTERNPGKKSFRGTLFVVTDINTASSGETFAGLARQIPGAVLVGENSRGCTTYGIADIIQRLPVSRLAVRFGWVRFNWAGVYPIREGVGFFPDYWIDEVDPGSTLARLASWIKSGQI